MNKHEFYQRVSGLLEIERLAARRVMVIGLGSGGARVAAELGRLGVSLCLVERPDERLEEHNIVRHLLGYRSLGKPKLTEMVRHIRNLNPSTPLTTCSLDVVEDQRLLDRRLKHWEPDVIAVCTDNEPSKHAVNESALRLGIPQVGAGVYDGGIGGEVYRVQRGTACYGCIAAQLRLDARCTTAAVSHDYSRSSPEAPRSTCALNLDIEQIALLQSRLVLEWLVESPATVSGLAPEVNLCVFANRVVPGTFARPLQAQFFSIPKRTECLECGRPTENIEAEAQRIVADLQRPLRAG